MTYDFYAALRDKKIGVKYNEIENKVSDILTRAKLLKLSKNREKAKKKYRAWIKKQNFEETTNLMENLDLRSICGPKDLKEVILIRINFSLKKSFLSKDDEEFYLLDNPVCKDKVFKVPMIRSSSWKGTLRHAAIKVCFREFDSLSDEERIDKRLVLCRLFGNEKDNVKKYLDKFFGENLKSKFEKKLRKYYEKRKDQEISVRGRLIFYPTFFNSIGLDIINPHDRKTKTGKNPITLETVPENTKGEFYLLYFPFDILGEKEKIKEEENEDIPIVVDAVFEMLTKYGFGAKTTSGYGVSEIENINVNGKDYGKDFCKMLGEVLK